MDIDDLSLKTMTSAHSNLTLEGLGPTYKHREPMLLCTHDKLKKANIPHSKSLFGQSSHCVRACPAKKKKKEQHHTHLMSEQQRQSSVQLSALSLFPTNWPGRGLFCCLITSLGHTAERQQPSKWPECGCSQYSCLHLPVEVKGLDERVRSKWHGKGAGCHSTYIKHLDICREEPVATLLGFPTRSHSQVRGAERQRWGWRWVEWCGTQLGSLLNSNVIKEPLVWTSIAWRNSVN